jgi:hypothetical protein
MSVWVRAGAGVIVMAVSLWLLAASAAIRDIDLLMNGMNERRSWPLSGEGNISGVEGMEDRK